MATIQEIMQSIGPAAPTCVERKDPRTTHGLSRSPTYRRWVAMLQRCYNEKCANYPRYGGRGISVDISWHTFENFYADMGPMPIGYSIEREDVDGNYCKDNCSWIPRGAQGRNKRTTRWVELDGERMSLQEARIKLKVVPRGIYYRINKFGETPQQAIDHFRVLRRGS